MAQGEKPAPPPPPEDLPGHVNYLAQQLPGVMLEDATPITDQIQKLVLAQLEQWMMDRSPTDVEVRRDVDMAFSELHYPLSGQAAAFAYDLARSVAYTRQGNPAWSGEARDAANAPPIRAYNLFYGAASFDPEPDWVDFNNIQIPQADEQQRLLANLILQMNSGKKPLPRFWYLPGGFKAAVVMTGDDHGSYYGSSATDQRFQDFLAASPAGCSVANWQCVRGTAYLFPSVIATNSLTNAQIAAYIARGFEFGVHVDSATDCQDWTTSQLDTQYATFLSSLATEYPAIPAPQTHRMHCISWSDYDSQPTIELKHGIRFDTTYYYWPSTWINDRPGMFTGSGMPMRYVDRNGNLINVYQATTQMTD